KGCRPPEWNELARRDEMKSRAEGRRLLYVACTRARDLLVIPRPPSDTQVGDFWRELLPHLDRAPADEVVAVEARTLPVPAPSRERMDPAALAGVEPGDALAARWRQ